MPKRLGYKCSNCGYSKRPVTHSASDCDGVIYKIASEYKCDACGKTLNGVIKCTKCGNTIYDI